MKNIAKKIVYKILNEEFKNVNTEAVSNLILRINELENTIKEVSIAVRRLENDAPFELRPLCLNKTWQIKDHLSTINAVALNLEEKIRKIKRDALISRRENN